MFSNLGNFKVWDNRIKVTSNLKKEKKKKSKTSSTNRVLAE